MGKKRDVQDRTSSIRDIRSDEEKQDLLKFLNPFLMHEVRDKIEFLAMSVRISE